MDTFAAPVNRDVVIDRDMGPQRDWAMQDSISSDPDPTSDSYGASGLSKKLSLRGNKHILAYLNGFKGHERGVNVPLPCLDPCAVFGF